MQMKNIQVLDCTLRDGGYVNNWEFDHETALGIIDRLQRAGLDFVELGIMGKTAGDRERVKFDNFELIEPYLKKRAGVPYTLILNYTDVAKFPDVPARSEKTVDCIRLAYFKVDWKASVEYAKGLMEKGYQVFLQTMATPLYTDEELKELIEAVNKVNPYAFYIVDSFGMLLNREVVHLADLVERELDSDIRFGLHAHNNTQMAFSNTMTFVENVKKHDLIVDSSVFGMGRGAGNCATELIGNYLNKYYGKHYNMDLLIEIFEKYLHPVFEKYYWGYSMDYYLTASKNVNSAYAWYLRNIGGVISDMKLNKILDNIPAGKTYTLFKDVADEARKKYEENS